MRRYIILAAALLAGAALGAQNLNPTVQVTNDYQGKPMEVEKQKVQMAVPDSLLKFDWNFNYSVFDNPYKGAYEFSPYRIEMKPDATVRDNRRFFLRAGAGYSLHPEGQLVFTPDIKGKFGISVYDDFKGYFGKYNNIVAEAGNGVINGPYTISRDGDYGGSELSNRVGTELRYDARRTVFTLDAGMDLMKTKEQYIPGNDMLGGSATLRARSVGESDLLYDISAGWTGFVNKLKYNDSSDRSFTEHDAGFDARFVYLLTGNHSVRFEPSWHHVMFGQTGALDQIEYTWGEYDAYISADPFVESMVTDVVEIAPSYVFSNNGLSLMAGIVYSNAWNDNAYSPLMEKRRSLFPNLRLYYEAVPDKVVLSAKLTGGRKFNTYGSYLKGNHHLPELSSSNYANMLGDATVNAFDAGVGFSGRVGSRLQVGAEAGFARYLNAPMDWVYQAYQGPVMADQNNYFRCHPCLVMADYDLVYADLTGSYNSDRLEGSAHLRVQHSEIKQEAGDNLHAFPLPLFTGSAALTYNWNRRLFAGVSAEWATSRSGNGLAAFSYNGPVDCTVPGWVDLGVNAEFRANNRLSFWAEGRNLLNHMVMRDFLISEKGPYFTAGICLNL